jgi:predicted transposase YbfD/YdcC
MTCHCNLDSIKHKLAGSHSNTTYLYREIVAGSMGIENSLHDVLDEVFAEDASRIRK